MGLETGGGPLPSFFPGGFASGVVIRNMPAWDAFSDKVIWVDSVNGNNGNPGTFQKPLSTVAYAFSSDKPNANAETIIACKAGHAETISAAGTITADIAGVRVVSFGKGADRAEFTFSATTSSILITAANVSFENVVIIPSIDAVTNPFHVQAAGVNLDFEVAESDDAIEFERAVLGTSAADNLSIRCRYRGRTGGNACVNAVRLVGSDAARIYMDFYGKASTSIVEFLTTACTDVDVTGYMYNSGTTNGSKNVVDTVTGSTWYMDVVDGAAGSRYTGGSAAAVASDDVTAVLNHVSGVDSATNVLGADDADNGFASTNVAGNADGSVLERLEYIQATGTAVPTADASTNTTERDVIGNKTDAAVYVPGTTKSVAAYAKGIANLQEGVAKKAAATMVNGQTIFTVAGGPIEIMALVSVCETTNDGTASTLQYNITPTTGSATTISAASASLAAAAAGASVALAGTALATAALLSAGGPNLMANPGTIFCPIGVITMVIGVGSTTGTWAHYLRYKPLAVGVTVS